MRLAAGIFVDNEKTFGELKFAAMRRVRFKNDENGVQTTEVTGRTYDLRCKAQGETIQVTLPAGVEEKAFEYGALVELVDPEIQSIADRSGVNIHIKAADIVLKGRPGGNTGNRPGQQNQTPGGQGQEKKG